MVSKFWNFASWSGYVSYLEVYAGTDSTSTEHYAAFSVVDRSCQKLKNTRHAIYVNKGSFSPTIFDHLWAYGIKAVVAVLPNRKLLERAFVAKLRSVKITQHRNNFSATKLRDVHILSSADDDCVARCSLPGETTENKTCCHSCLQRI